MSRYADAIAIQAGACNPFPITETLRRGLQEVREEEGFPTGDPALRLIVHQLAHLFNVREFDNHLLVYEEAVDTCKRKEKTP